jgi:hypothetical protein
LIGIFVRVVHSAGFEPLTYASSPNPAKERELDHHAITIKELCEKYLEDAKAGLMGLGHPARYVGMSLHGR